MLKYSYTFDAFGTKWNIETEESLSESIKAKIQKQIESFDLVYSRFNEQSLVTRISKKAGKYNFPNNADVLFGFYKKLYELTDKKTTPLIGDMLSRAGYDARYSFKPQLQKPALDWGEVMSWSNGVLETKQPLLLDFGAAGKGYMVDILAKVLDESLNEYVIDASGDLKHKGSSENKVGLEHPLDTSKVIGVVDVQNKSLCASSSNRRTWATNIHHIFDPSKMAPVQDVIASWVIADETMIADGLATALFFSEPNKLKEEYDFEYVRMFADGGIEYSAYFKDALFS